MNIAIIGGGASAHLASVLLAGRGHRVRIMSSRPNEWSRELQLETAEGELLSAEIDGVTSDVSSVIQDAEVAFLCMPVHQYPNALWKLMPALARNRKCIVGAIYGQGGIDWMVKSFCCKVGIPTLRHFAIGLLPWIARTQVYGRKAISYGPKYRNAIACSDESVFELLQANVLSDLSFNYWACGAFEQVPNFLTLTLTVDNQIIHPSRCFSLAKGNPGWKSEDDIPYFYRDFTAEAAEVLKGVDVDYTSVRKTYFKKFPNLDNAYNLDYLGLEHWSYGSHNPDIRSSFLNSKTLKDIKPPVVRATDGLWKLDANHRFFKDDFAFGLEICKWFADKLGCTVPHVDKLIDWYRCEMQPKQDKVLEAATPSWYGLETDVLSGIA